MQFLIRSSSSFTFTSRFLIMQRLNLNLVLFLATVCAALSVCGCRYDPSSSATGTPAAAPALPPATPLYADNKSVDRMIRFLEERVRRDPEDFATYNKLAGQYLQRSRETGNADYINLASRAALSSLASVPEECNTGGLAALAEAEFASHEFNKARDHASRLAELDPGKSYPYAILGDALLELGDYDEASRAFQRMERVNDGISHGSETRRARLSFLRGDNAGATRHLTNALALALDLPAPPHEVVAWCRWQLGETAFAVGDYQTAERHYRDALVTLSDY